MRIPYPSASHALLVTQNVYSECRSDNHEINSELEPAAEENYSWNFSEHSNGFDKVLGYQKVLADMRKFVREGDELSNATITIKDISADSKINLTFTNNNFTVTHINDHEIDYTYPDSLPSFDGGTFPYVITQFPNKVTLAEKAMLIYLFAEAARSDVIEKEMVMALSNEESVDLNKYSVIAHSYGHTCTHVGLSTAHPTRTLTCGDYCGYAGTLPSETPDLIDIENLCECVFNPS